MNMATAMAFTIILDTISVIERTLGLSDFGDVHGPRATGDVSPTHHGGSLVNLNGRPLPGVTIASPNRKNWDASLPSSFRAVVNPSGTMSMLARAAVGLSGFHTVAQRLDDGGKAR
jgi:hypothetical protein